MMNSAIAGYLSVLCLVVLGFLLIKISVVITDDNVIYSQIILNITLPSVIFSTDFPGGNRDKWIASIDEND
jgi:predicted permease